MTTRDIRSYFNIGASKKPVDAAKPTKVAKRAIILSSDEETSPKPKAKERKTKSKVKSPNTVNKNHLLSDSDDEVSHRTAKSKPKSPVKKNEKELKPVTVDSIFGKAPVKRVNVPPEIKELTRQEALIHEDDDFEATLNQIDSQELDLLFLQDLEKKEKSSKRKKIDSEEETPPKKPKLDEQPDEKKPIKEKVDEQSREKKPEKENDKKPSGNISKSPKVHESKKSSVNNEKSSSKIHHKTSKIEVVVEKKKSETKNSSKEKDVNFDPFEENIAKKKQHAATYQQYLHRGGARNPGSKPIPEGAPNCLAGLSFVITGVLDSLERDEADELIKKYGGRVVAALSRKTDYLVVGDEPGQSKLTKAQVLNVKLISEDELLELIKSRPAGKASAVLHNRSKKKEKSPHKELEKTPPEKKSPKKIEKIPPTVTEKKISPLKMESSKKDIVSASKPETKQSTGTEIKSESNVSINQAEALVEKYRPKTMKQIIGQHGDRSSARKLYIWLNNWHKNHNGKTKLTKPSPWAKNDDGSFFKACLLSGPPGVGKTTSVQVVCNELGFDLLEFNASDTRSKKLLKEEVSGLLSNTTVKGYFTNKTETKTSAKHVLVMDEVDGMAGNEDRGGLQELIALIKSTDIPIVCICNDRNNPKMRTLANYTFDLRFQKPKLEQIRGAMKSLCCRENINITTEDLDHLIQSTNNDIRQVINHLAMLVGESTRKGEESSSKLNKDLKLGPWDVVRKVFSAEEHKKMTIHDKSSLFFHDYNIAGLFVQENYLSVIPHAPKEELLDRVAASADSLSLGDLAENSIRSNGAWSLLPMQACYSSVIPGTLMSGHIGAQINFPSWLGRNSKTGKFDRLLQEITVHTRLVTGASKEAINLDYLKPLRDAIMRPLIKNGSEGVDTALNVMNHYHLLRDDLDALVEVSLWPGQRDPMQEIESKVKAAFTRAYNKSSAMTPFAVSVAASKKKSAAPSQDEGFIEGEEEGDNESEEDEDDLDTDRMIKAKKPSTSKPSTNKPSTSKKATVAASKGREKPAAKRGRGRGK